MKIPWLAATLAIALAASAFSQPELESGRLSFTTQEPVDPRLFDSPATTNSPCVASVNPMEVAWAEPAAGVNAATGLLLVFSGIGPGNDCTRELYVPDPSWIESRNLVVANVFYRNLAYLFPYDFGKLQVVDVLRGTGAVLDALPQLDRRRLYIYGGSGGGHLALQVLHASPHLWSEVVTHSAITRITVRDDVLALYDRDPANGWNVNLNFPVVQGSQTSERWDRIRAERALRSPQSLVDALAPVGDSPMLPLVASMHGTNDGIVDYQHLQDLRDLVAAKAGLSPAPVPAAGETISNWRFQPIVDGGHGYEGAALDEASRVAATNKYLPDAFTRSLPTAPSLEVSTTFPDAFGWTWSFEGETLAEVALHMQQLPAAATGWQTYY